MPLSIENRLPLSTVTAIEKSLIASWPSLVTVVDGRWLLRAANGFTGRANSVCILGDDGTIHPDDLNGRIAHAEAFYSRAGLVPTFRITPLTPHGLVTELHQRGYVDEDYSLVLTGALPQASPQLGTEGFQTKRDEDTPGDAWLNSAAALSNRVDFDRQTLAELTRRLGCNAAFFQCSEDKDAHGDHAAAITVAACHKHWLTVHNVATASHQRRRGFARHLMWASIKWARDKGAQKLWIAVDAENAPAVGLYESLGLTLGFTYFYARKRKV